jgi:hypothetical protein
MSAEGKAESLMKGLSGRCVLNSPCRILLLNTSQEFASFGLVGAQNCDGHPTS